MPMKLLTSNDRPRGSKAIPEGPAQFECRFLASKKRGLLASPRLLGGFWIHKKQKPPLGP